MNKKSIFILFSVLAVLAFFVGAFYLQKKVLPQQIHQVQVNLNVPVRYAFMTVKDKPKLMVFDTYTSEAMNILPLKTTADLISVSRLGGYLAYAKRGGRRIYLMDLETYANDEIALDSGIEQLSADSSGRWIIYATQTKVYQINRKDKKVIKEIPVMGEVSLTFMPNGESVILAELNSGRIRQFSFIDNAVNELVNVGQKISPVSIMPDDQAFFFNSGGQLYRYDLVNTALMQSNVSTPRYRPYISSDNRNLLVLSQADGQSPTLMTLNPKDLTLIKSYPLPNVQPLAENDSVIATGWLDQVAIVAGQKAVYLVDLSSGEVKTVMLFGQIIDMVVQSDSKMLLLDTLNTKEYHAKPNFVTIDLRQQILTTATAWQIDQPMRIVMGQTNTLCH